MRTSVWEELGYLVFACLVCASIPVNAAPYVYVAVTADDNVSVIDTANDTILKKIPVPHRPVGIATNEVGNRVYVGSSDTSTVSVIETLSDTVVDGIVVGNNPISMAYNAANRHLYVSDDEGIAVIDTRDDTLVKRIPGVSTIGFCEGVAVNHAGSRVYVAGAGEYGNGYVWVIDTGSDTVVAAIHVAPPPCALVVSPDDSTVYVTPGYSQTAVARVHVADNSVDSAPGLSAMYSSMASSLDGTQMYVPEGPVLRTFDVATGELLSSMPLAASGYSYGMALGGDSNKFYVADSASNTVSVEDIFQQKYLQAVTVGCFPMALLSSRSATRCTRMDSKQHPAQSTNSGFIQWASQ